MVFEILLFIIDITLCQGTELFDAAVAQEWPPLAHGLAPFEAYLNDLTLLLFVQVGNELALRASDEAMPPELYAVCHSRRVGLMTATVDSNHRQAICDGMTTLHCLPGTKLACLLFGRVAALPTNGSGVDEQLGAA